MTKGQTEHHAEEQLHGVGHRHLQTHEAIIQSGKEGGGGGSHGFCLAVINCVGSGMIYSLSGSSYEILEFRIRIQPTLFEHIWKLLKNTP